MEQYSVLMSLYEKERPEYLSEALDSMIYQTVKPNQIVLVEDGPLTDELYAVVEKYCKDYPELFHIVVNKQNIGLGLALNSGLEICENELIARMDTDDISKPNRCEIQLKRFTENPNLSIVSSHIDEFVGTIDNVVSQRRVPISYEAIYNYAKKRSAFNHPAVMFKKSAVQAVGGYSDLKRNQDVDLFGRMLFNGCIAENIDDSLLWFRSSDELKARRKSWENTRTYIKTIWNFWKMGYSTILDVVLVSAAQIVLFLAPVRLQNWFYSLFLR